MATHLELLRQIIEARREYGENQGPAAEWVRDECDWMSMVHEVLIGSMTWEEFIEIATPSWRWDELVATKNTIDGPTDLVERLHDAAGWVKRQDTPAPSWDQLLAEAAVVINIMQLQLTAALDGTLEVVGSAHQARSGQWQVHGRNSLHMNDVNVYVIIPRDG